MRRGPKQLGLVVTLSLLAPDFVAADVLSTYGWWGSVGYTYQSRMIDNEISETKNILAGDINGKYYLWQPWFLTGKMRLTLTADSSSDTRTTRERTALGGSLDANILPQSKYPMTLGYEKRDNTIRDSSSLLNVGDTTTTRYSITQRYLGKKTRVTASFQANEVETEGTGTFTNTREKLEVRRRDPHSDLDVSYQHYADEEDMSDEGRDSEIATLRHNYYPSERVNVSSFASRVDQLDKVDIDGDGVVDEVNNDIDQLSSTAHWRSSDKKTHINGNLRYTGVVTGGPGSTHENLSTNIGLGIRRKIGDNFNVRASASHIDSELNSVEGETSIYLASLDYRSDIRKIAGYDYSWGSALAHTQEETDTASTSTTDFTLDHSASRNWRYGRRGQIRFSANQGFNHQENESQQSMQSLNHDLRIGYTQNANGGTRYAQASYTERRSISGNEELSQQLNLQYSQRYRINTRSSLSGSLGHQLTNYRDITQDNQSTMSTALLNYSLHHSFSFQTLSFDSVLSYSIHHANSSGDEDRYSWDNTLRHQVGQLSSSLVIRMQEEEGQQISLIQLNVKRKF